MRKLLNLKLKNLFFILMVVFLTLSPLGNMAHAASDKVYVGALAVSTIEKDKLKLHAQTNLPKKMKFFVKITGSDGFEKKVKLKVKKDGKLKKTVKKLPNGSYKILYQSYQPKKQTSKMREIIGEKGGNLKGDLVNKKKVVKFTENVQVSSSLVKSDSEIEAEEKAEKAKQAEEEAKKVVEEKAAKEKKVAEEAEKKKKEEAAKREKERVAEERAAEERRQAQEEQPQSEPEQSQGQIKGSYNGIYHVPGSTYYDRTKNVKEWFNTVEEAEKAGYRAPER